MSETNSPEKQPKNKPPIGHRFQKGESGNPKGRPRKEDCLTSILKEQLAELKPGDSKKRTWAECVVAAVLRSAARGNVRAIALILDRTEGKIRETLQLEGREMTIRWLTESETDAE